MTKLAKCFGALIVFTLTAFLATATAQPVSAISAELAKKCREMAIKAHPVPKPGSKVTGGEKAQRDYFSACVSKAGKMEN